MIFKGVKTLKMTSNKIKISNLTPKRVYYIRVRPFAMYENREEVYGAFSKIMKITVKWFSSKNKCHRIWRFYSLFCGIF